MQLKLLVALGADLPGLRVPAGRAATVVDAEARPERDPAPSARRASRSLPPAALPVGPRVRTADRGAPRLPAPSRLRSTSSTPAPASVAGAARYAIPAFDAGLVSGLPSVLDVTV